MPDDPKSGLTEDERQCVEAFARIYLLINSEDLDAAKDEKEDLSRCVRCLQDRILALPTKRRLRRPGG